MYRSYFELKKQIANTVYFDRGLGSIGACLADVRRGTLEPAEGLQMPMEGLHHSLGLIWANFSSQHGSSDPFHNPQTHDGSCVLLDTICRSRAGSKGCCPRDTGNLFRRLLLITGVQSRVVSVVMPPPTPLATLTSKGFKEPVSFSRLHFSFSASGARHED